MMDQNIKPLKLNTPLWKSSSSADVLMYWYSVLLSKIPHLYLCRIELMKMTCRYMILLFEIPRPYSCRINPLKMLCEYTMLYMYLVFQIIHPSGAKLLKSKLPNCCNITILENCGHSVDLDRPYASCNAIVRFRGDAPPSRKWLANSRPHYSDPPFNSARLGYTSKGEPPSPPCICPKQWPRLLLAIFLNLSSSSTGVSNSLSQLCTWFCFKCSINQWLEISWFSHTAGVSWQSAVAFSKRMPGVPCCSGNIGCIHS